MDLIDSDDSTEPSPPAGDLDLSVNPGDDATPGADSADATGADAANSAARPGDAESTDDAEAAGAESEADGAESTADDGRGGPEEDEAEARVPAGGQQPDDGRTDDAGSTDDPGDPGATSDGRGAGPAEAEAGDSEPGAEVDEAEDVEGGGVNGRGGPEEDEPEAIVPAGGQHDLNGGTVGSSASGTASAMSEPGAESSDAEPDDAERRGVEGGEGKKAGGVDVESVVVDAEAEAEGDVEGAEEGGGVEAEVAAEAEPSGGPEADVEVGAEPGGDGADGAEGGGVEAEVEAEVVEAEPEAESSGGPDVEGEVVEGGDVAAEAEPSGEPDDEAEAELVVAGRWRRGEGRWSGRRRVSAVLGAVPMVAVLLVAGGWAIDTATSSGQAVRNVELAGRTVGGLDEQALRQVTAELAEGQSDRSVSIRSGDTTYQSTAADLGLTVDSEATVDAALDAGRDGSPLLRPFRWAGSFLSPRGVPLRYTVDEAQTAATLEVLQSGNRTAPVEPTMPLTDAGLTLVPGRPGRGIDPNEVVDALLDQTSRSTDGTLVIETEPTRLEPLLTDADVQSLADRANAMTAGGLTVKAGPATVTLSAEQLRPWIGLTVTDEGPDLALDGEAVMAALPDLVGPVGDAPVNATVTLDPAGAPVVVPGHNGVGCCEDDSATRIWDALSAQPQLQSQAQLQSRPEVELDVREIEPEWTTEEVQAWGVTQPVGGIRAWRNGHDEAGPAPGFTTYHACCASRVTNIHRLADMVRGAVIPPGGDFSINGHVGQRTAAKGFVLAGAIAEGEHVDEIGGGVSQFATTTFNAAYFAGLDITSYQAHTEYFSRYPRGREGTMGYPAPDLVIHNNTPYGVLIWTSYTDTSLTVTLYSTPYATAEQTGISESSYGACRNVVTTRTRTYPDGTVTQDQFRATYRPGEGRFC
jgi:vancomycin resistance protein YoaR